MLYIILWEWTVLHYLTEIDLCYTDYIPSSMYTVCECVFFLIFEILHIFLLWFIISLQA